MRTYLRKALALTISLLMLCTLIPLGAMTSVSAADAVYSQNFEDGTTSGWGGDYAISAQTGTGGSGTYAMAVTVGATWQNLYRAVNVVADTDNVLTFKMKSTTAGAIHVKFLSGDWSATLVDSIQQATTSWTEYTVEFNLGSRTSAVLLFQPEVTGTFYFDDFSIAEKVEEPILPSGTPVLNKNFNDNVLGFNKGSVVAEGPDGSNCLKWSAGGNWGYTEHMAYGVAKNTDYIVTFKAKASVNGKMGTTIQNGDRGAYKNTDSFTVTNSWTEFSLTFNSADYPTSDGRLLFKFQDVGLAMDLYIDDLVIVAKVDEPEPEPDEPTGTNLIANSDFESGISGWAPQASGTASATTTDPGAGNQSLKLDCSTADYNLVGVKVTVKPNTDYVLTFLAKVTSADLMLNFLSGNTLVNDNVGGKKVFGCTSSWKSYSHEFNSASYSSLTLNFQSAWAKGANSAIYLDNVVLIEKAALPQPDPDEPTGENLVINGDFEEGNTGWRVGTGGSIVDGGYTGKAFQMNNPSAWGEVGYQEVVVDAYATYTMTWRSKRVSGTGVFNMEIAKAPYDKTKPQITAITNQTWMNDTSGDWISHKVNIVMEDDSGKGITQIMIKLTTEASNAGVILIDDICLTKIPEASFDGYIYDGDFELNDWSAKWISVSGAAAELVAGHESSKALSITAGKWAQVRQKFYVAANTDYIITLWIKDTTDITLLLKTGVDDQNFWQRSLSASSTWKEVSFEFNSGENTSLWLGFMGQESGNGVAVIDDVKIAPKVAEIHPETLIKFGGTSIKENTAGIGLAFSFQIYATNGKKNYDNSYVESSAQLLLGDNTYELVRMGAVMTNDPTVGNNADTFLLSAVDGKRTKNINGKYLKSLNGDTVSFAVRILDIPESHHGDDIYARPYYVYNQNGTEVTVYGAIRSNNYAKVSNPKSSIKILSIGHSFSKDVMKTNLYNMFKEGGYDEVVIAYLYMAGCSMPKHLYNIQNNLAGYEYSKNSSGTWDSNHNATALDALQDEEWDYVTVQSSPDYIGGQSISGFNLGVDNKGQEITLDKPMTEYEAMNEIIDWINANALKSSVKIDYHMIWSFSEDCELWSYTYHDFDQMAMYNNIITQTENKVANHPEIVSIIPSATAIQNARTSFMGDNFNMPVVPGTQADGYHLNDDGDYVAALTWYCHYSGESALVMSGYTGCLNLDQFAAVAEAVDNAIQTWDQVTESTHK